MTVLFQLGGIAGDDSPLEAIALLETLASAPDFLLRDCCEASFGIPIGRPRSVGWPSTAVMRGLAASDVWPARTAALMASESDIAA